MKTYIISWTILIFVCLISNGCQQNKPTPNPPTVSPTLPTPESNEPTPTPSTQVEKPSSKSIPKKNPKKVQAETSPQKEQSTKCDQSNFDLIKNIKTSVKALKGTPYSQAKKTDCSGMFHKVLDGIKKACPNSILPSIKKVRSTRDLAKWYYDHGDFQIIKNPKEESQLIQERAVMFYGYGTRKWPYDYETMTIDMLIIRGVGINHIAIVTKVNRENGIVQSYDIFHGRNPRKPAGVTTSHRVYDRHPGLPVYGNWKEPWLAVANVLGTKK